ncbi:MAG: hypothetical protein UFA98_11775 [Ruminococcus sp.]|nr:hypothetical protein [Ruminococcus sp.]
MDTKTGGYTNGENTENIIKDDSASVAGATAENKESQGTPLDVKETPYAGISTGESSGNALVTQQSAVQPAPIKNKKSKIIIICAAIAVVALIVITALALVLPKMLVSTEDLLKEKKYVEAYNRAKDDKDKKQILAENIAAYTLENEVISSLNNPESFHLSEIRYRWEEPDTIVLKGSEENEYGRCVSAYYYILYNEELEKFTLLSTLTSLEEESFNKSEGLYQMMEKIKENAHRSNIKENYLDNDSKIGNSAVKRINQLIQNDELEDIELIRDDDSVEEYPTAVPNDDDEDETEYKDNNEDGFFGKIH